MNFRHFHEALSFVMLNLLPQFAGKEHIIWDWNGTLLDDVDFCIEIIAAMLADHGLPSLDKNRYLKRFRFPIVDYYEELGFRYDLVPFAALSKHFITTYKAGMETRTQLYAGVRDILEELAKRGVACSMLSANHEGDLLKLLEKHRLRDYFVYVYGLGDHHAVSKLERGKQLMQAIAHDPDKVLLVGDTDHDLEVGTAMGIDVLLLSGGHQCDERLRSLHPRVAKRS